MKIVEKWIAGFWLDKLIVAKWKFSETAKQFCVIQGGCKEYRQAEGALGYKTRVPKDSGLVHATAADALDALHQREMRNLRSYNKEIERVQDRLDRIDGFETSTLTQ